MTVYVVVYSNYEPSETDSIWETEEQANRACELLDDDAWCVIAWKVNDADDLAARERDHREQQANP